MEKTISPAEKWPAWLAVLKISKVTFWFVWVTPLVYGYISSATRFSAHHPAWFGFTIMGVCLLEAITCIHNELVDQEEDSLNQPRRTDLLASLDQRKLWISVWIGYGLCLIGIGLVAVFVSLPVGAFMALAGICAPLYNAGPRFKRRPGFAELAIGWAIFFGYLAGSAWNAPVDDTSPVIWVMSWFFAITSLIKNLPDVVGDERVNAASVFSIRQPAVQHAALTFIYLSPFVFLVVFVTLGLLPWRFVLMLALLPVAWTAMILSRRATRLTTMIAAYELTFLYVHMFLLALFVIDTPTIVAVVVGAALFVGRALSVVAGLAPRFVEREFSWTRSLRALMRPE